MEIHATALEILSGVGIRVEDSLWRDRLHGFGCRVEGDRVYFPSDRIRDVLAAPRRPVALGRTSSESLAIFPETKPLTQWTHTSGGIPFVLDPEDGRKRLGRQKDLVAMAQLVNCLDAVDVYCPMVYMEDVPPQINQVKQAELALRHSAKPIYVGISSQAEAKYVIALLETAGQGDLHHNPAPGIVGISPESPLHYPRIITATMEHVIASGVPTVILAAPIAGLTAPFTLAGGLAQMHANILAFAVIAHLIHPATPLIYGCRLSFANMRTGNSIWGLPEVGLAGAAAVQLARHCGFPSDVYGLGCTACVPDTQAGYEKAANGLLSLISGAHLLSGVGALASLTVCAYEQIVIDNEIIRMLGGMQRGITVNQDTLAAEVIARAAAGENYLEQDHTLAHLRGGAQFMPQLGFDDLWDEWQSVGGRDLRGRAIEQVRKLLADPAKSCVSDKMHAALADIMASAASELAFHSGSSTL